MGNRYPKDIATIGKPGKTLSAEFNVGVLEPGDWQDNEQSKGTSPMKIFTSWSGLKLNFAENRDGKNIGGDGQIEMSHIPDVLERSRNASRLCQEYQASKKGGTKHSPLLELRVKFLPMDMASAKGQSVAEIAAAFSPEQVENAAARLYEQAAKGGAYAQANAKQALALRVSSIARLCKKTPYGSGTLADVFMQDWDSIFKACSAMTGDEVRNIAQRAYKIFRLVPEYRDILADDLESGETARYWIYEPVFKTPNNHKVDKDGLVKAYELSVACNPAAEYPISVKLTTMRAKPAQGAVGITSRESIKDAVTFTQDMPVWKWLEMVEGFDTRSKALINVCISQAYKAMLRFEDENRSASRQQMPA